MADFATLVRPRRADTARLFWAGLVALALIRGAAFVSATRQDSTAWGAVPVVVVSDDPLNTPLANTEVTLTALGLDADAGFIRSTMTGEDGTCVFIDIPAGQYTVRAGKPGYVTTFFGATPEDADPTPIVVGERTRGSRIEVRLPAGGAITGTVRDRRSMPAPRVSVVLMELLGDERRVARMSDAAGAGAVVRTETDSQGAYRLYGLPRGSYVVQATGVDQPKSAANPIMSRGYYPASIDPVGASVVTVSPGQELSGIDVQLQQLPLVDVSGFVSPASSQETSRLRLLMFPDGLFSKPEAERDGRFILASPDGLFSNPIAVRADGSFVIRGVLPGQYEIWARSVPRDGLAQDDPGPASWGRTAIGVSTQDLSGVVISSQSAATISGRVDLDAPGSPTLKDGTIVLVPTEPPSMRSRSLRVPGTIRPDGTFRLNGVTPGRYMFEVLSADAVWSLTSARASGRDFFEAPVEIGSDDAIRDVVVKVSRARQLVSGTLLDRAERPLSGLRLVVFPDDRRLWVGESRRIRTAKTATDGTFAVWDLPAGSYRVGATTMRFDNTKFDPAVLEALASASVPFTLGRGESKFVDIRLAR